MQTMIIPPAFLARRDQRPDETLEETMWWFHTEYMPLFDRAADELGGMTVNRFSELVGLWAGDHLPRTQGWGSELVALRKRVAVELVTTKLTADRLATLLGVTPRTFAEHVTSKHAARQWLVWDEAVCDGADRRTATDLCGISMDTTRRWAKLRPWTRAALEQAAERDQPPAVAAVSFLFEQGMMPIEAHRWWCDNKPDEPYGLSAVQHAFQVWRRRNPEAAKAIREADCATCGETFVKRNAHALYCSKSCGWKASNGRQKAKLEAMPVSCAGCGTTFKATHANARWCSQACNNRYRKRRQRQADVTANEQGFCVGAPTQNIMDEESKGDGQ